MKKLISVLVAGSLLVVGSQAAVAQQANKVRPTYTYAGIQYITQKLDNLDCRQDGLKINGSYDFGNQIFARASFGDVSGDNGCGSSSFSAGGGYKVAWGETSHLYALLGFQSYSADDNSDDSGLAVGGGIRGYVSQGIEAYFELEYATIGDGDVNANFGGAYWFNKNFSATGDISYGADQNSFAIGGRMTF